MSEMKITTITPKRKPIKNWEFLTDLIEKWFGKSVIRYNKFTQLLEVSRILEWDKEEFDHETGEAYPEDSWVYQRQWDLLDTGYLRRKIDQSYPKMNFSESSVLAAVEYIARSCMYSPVEEHINKIPEWDEKPRLNTWLLEWCHASGPREEIISIIGRKFIIGMIKRGLDPGVKFDNMLILEGKQGIGKSSLARILAGNDKLFSDDVVSDLTDSRQILEKYAGKFVIEIGELSSFSRMDQKLLKRFIVTQIDTGRPAYGRYAMSIPRSFSFIGTTNEARYFEDETGLRRYWPIRVTNLDLVELKDNRDQLLAEAKHVIKWDEEAHYLKGDYEVALEQEYEEFKKSKLRCGNDKLLFWIRDHWDEIANNKNEKNEVSGVWLYEFVVNNYEGIFSTKQYSLVMQMLGASSLRRHSGAWWKIPSEVKPFDPGV